MAPPSRNGPSPRMRPSLTAMLCPSGNNVVRISSSVIGSLPLARGAPQEFIRAKVGDSRRFGYAQRRPDIGPVPGRAEALETAFQPSLLGLQDLEAEPRGTIERGERRLAESAGLVVDEGVRAADQVAMFAAHGPPDQGAVAGVEFLDALVGLDHFGAADADAPLFGDDQGGAAAGEQAAAAVAAGASADQADHLRARQPRLDEGAHDLADRQLAGIGLLEPDAAGVEQDHHVQMI